MHTALMKRLAGRKGLAKRLEVEFFDAPWPYLKVNRPIGVARVLGEAKREAYGQGRVFVRGQIRNHEAMRPSLFRRAAARADALHSAEIEFVRKLGERITVARFRAPNLGGLLQHYGFRTSWLDVLDNLFMAYWFASNKISEEPSGAIKACESEEPTGWLFLLRPPSSGTIVDLRAQHHALSSRPHVQHGVSLACGGDGTPDFQDWIVATIQTSVAQCVGGALFTAPALFPPAPDDHTLKLLLKHDANELAARIEESHHLQLRTLGRTSYWSAAA